MKGKKGKAAAKNLLLQSTEEEEVDEPIAASESVPQILLQPSAVEEEEDEPLLPESEKVVESGGDTQEDNNMQVEGAQNSQEQPVLDLQRSAEPDAVVELNGCSEEFNEAMSAIVTDSWDISSWIIYYEEVQQGRGGDVTVVDAYEKIINQFPRSARFWKYLAEYYLQKNDHANAEATFRKCLHKCRSVELWRAYLNFQASLFNETLRGGLAPEQYLEAQSKCENVFNEAIANVGISVGAFPLWRSYIDFVKTWPEMGMVESGKKLRTLREIYQRALCVAMDQAEEIWNEYEAFEKAHGDPATVEVVLPEVNRKYSHAKSIMRERKKFMLNIVFDRLSTPPTNATNELQQLEYWGTWISFEMSGPDYLNPDSYVPMLRMVFEQCLCCFRFNAEVWLSYAAFEKDEVPKRLLDLQFGPGQAQANNTDAIVAAKKVAANCARSVYMDAIDANPGVTLLRCALAELEEGAGLLDAAKEVLRVTFEQHPCGATFAMFQRFIRRNLGIVAARRVFSETHSMRQKDPALALELFLSNAKLELEVNCSAQVALNVLNLAQKACPQCFKDPFYIKAITRVLTLLGDLKQIRWVFQTALNEFAGSNGSLALSKVTAHLHDRPGRRVGRNNQAATAALTSNHAQLKAELQLWEEYLRAETVLGLSDVVRLDELRSCRDKVKVIFDEAERVRLGVVYATKDEARAAQQRGIFHPAQDLCDRYDAPGTCTVWTLPELDQSLQERCGQMLSGIGTHGRRGPSDQADRARKQGDQQHVQNMSTEFHLSLAGLPVILRDLLGRLPFHSGPLPDLDGFIRHMKGVILPPRPEPEVNVVSENGDALGGVDGDGEGGFGAAAPSWLGKHSLDDADVDTEDGDDGDDKGTTTTAAAAATVVEEDVFRKRKRTRKAT